MPQSAFRRPMAPRFLPLGTSVLLAAALVACGDKPKDAEGGAGAPPPELAGRAAILEQAHVLLGRVKARVACNIPDFCMTLRPMLGDRPCRIAASERFSMPSWSITRRIAGAVCCVFSFLAASPTCAAEVAVDVGHTLAATGAVSARGRKEFDFNRVLAGRVVDALVALLESVSAHDAYQSIYHDTVSAPKVAELLILNPDVPRSLAACFGEISQIVAQIAGPRGRNAKKLAAEMAAALLYGDIQDILAQGMQNYLHHFLGQTAELDVLLHTAFMEAL